MAVGTVETYLLFASPGQYAFRRAEQPAVQVAHEQGAVRDRREAASELLRGVGRAVEVPEVLDAVRVEPRLDVAEQWGKGPCVIITSRTERSGSHGLLGKGTQCIFLEKEFLSSLPARTKGIRS